MAAARGFSPGEAFGWLADIVDPCNKAIAQTPFGCLQL
jgi:hypothetical protein